MNVFENEKTVSMHFDSATELLDFDFASTPYGMEGKSEHLQGGYNPRGGSWLGKTNSNNEDVITKSLVGDRDILPYLQDKIDKLAAIENASLKESVQSIQQIKRKRTFSDQGDELDIEKVYNGQLDTAWSKTVRIEQDSKHKLVTLFIQNGGTAKKDANDSFWRSAIAVLLCQKLVAAGKSVKIIVGNASEGALVGTSKLQTSSIVIKQYNETLTMERLAAMTHLGFYRTFGFAAKYISDYKPDWGLGRTTKINSEAKLPVNLQNEIKAGHTKCIVIPELYNEYTAIAALQNAYNELGGK